MTKTQIAQIYAEPLLGTVIWETCTKVLAEGFEKKQHIHPSYSQATVTLDPMLWGHCVHLACKATRGEFSTKFEQMVACI